MMKNRTLKFLFRFSMILFEKHVLHGKTKYCFLLSWILTENRHLLLLESTVNDKMTVLNGRVDVLDTRVDRVGAGAAALAGLHPLDYDPENRWNFAAEYGNYKGANAIAVGAFYRPDENKIISIGGSFGGGENMISAGISVKLGQGTGISTSKAAMANEIRELKARDREREAQMQEIMRQLEILRRQAGK